MTTAVGVAGAAEPVTVDWLERKDACGGQVVLFVKTFGDTAAPTAENVRKELACRASAPCMTARIVAYTCPHVALRRTYLKQIATEKANPAGVVNLANLHDWGASVQVEDAAIAAGKAEMIRWTKKPFSEASCK